MIAGQRSADVGGNVQFYEFYDSTGGYLDVHIPLALAGWFNYSAPDSFAKDVECQYLSVTDNYLPSRDDVHLGVNNNGVNATGNQPLTPGAAVRNAQYNIWVDALGPIAAVVPKLHAATPLAWYSMYKTYEGAAKVVGSPYVTAASGTGGQVIQSYQVINGTWWQNHGRQYGDNVFGPQIYVDVHINKTDFPVVSPGLTFNVQGEIKWARPDSNR